jgi:hypothetical protein
MSFIISEVILDLRQQFDCRLAGTTQLLHAERKACQHRPDHEIDDHRPQQKKNRRGDEVRQERLPFLPIKSRRDEHVDLAGDHREGDERRAEHRELELNDEIFEQAGIDELGIFRAGHPDVGPGQYVVDLRAKKKQTTAASAKAASALMSRPRSSTGGPSTAPWWLRSPSLRRRRSFAVPRFVGLGDSRLPSGVTTGLWPRRRRPFREHS